MISVVDAALYVGRGVRSSPIAKGENSGDGDRDAIVDLWSVNKTFSKSDGG